MLKMTKNYIYFYSLVTLIFFFSFIKIGFSQSEINKSYQLCLTNLPIQDFTFIYTQRINDKINLEISNSFVIHKAKVFDNGAVLYFTLKDPFRLYDMYRLRIGNRYFLDDENYVCPMFIFNYGRYENGIIRNYIDDKGSDAHDLDYKLNRSRFDIGAIIKFGNIKTYDNRFIRDIYFGIGLKVKFFSDDILAIGPWVSDYSYESPIHDNHIGFMPTIHFGIGVGYFK